MAIQKLLRRFAPWLLAGMVAVTTAMDYLTGPDIRFPILYLAPIALASWGHQPRWGYALALAMPLTRLCFGVFWPEIWDTAALIPNALIRVAVFTFFAYLINQAAQQHRALLHEVRVLRGLLTICSFCKKIRNDMHEWMPLEGYIHDHSEARFSHGLCPDCLRQHYPEYDIHVDPS